MCMSKIARWIFLIMYIPALVLKMTGTVVSVLRLLQMSKGLGNLTECIWWNVRVAYQWTMVLQLFTTVIPIFTYRCHKNILQKTHQSWFKRKVKGVQEKTTTNCRRRQRLHNVSDHIMYAMCTSFENYFLFTLLSGMYLPLYYHHQRTMTLLI